MAEKDKSTRIRLGLEIQDLREKRGITQKQLGELAGLPASSISRIETGKFNAGVDILAKIADILNHEIKLIRKKIKKQ